MSHPFDGERQVVELEGRIFHRTLTFGYGGGYRSLTGNIDIHAPYDAAGRAVAFEYEGGEERRWNLDDPEQLQAFRIRLRLDKAWRAA